VPIENPSVSFTPENIKLTGDVKGQGTKLEVLGTLVQNGGNLAFKLTSLKLGGIEVPFYRREVEKTINDLFQGVLAGKTVQSAKLGDGTLTLVVSG
jgi:hypothetical protein